MVFVIIPLLILVYHASVINSSQSELINMFNNNETKVHIPLHRALRVRRGRREAGRYQYYKLHDGRHPGDELKKKWMEMILTRLEQYLL